LFCSLKTHHVAVLIVAAFTALRPGQLAAQPPEVTLTQIGSPLWRPTDFQLFTAPADTDEDYNSTIDMLTPLHGPGGTAYTPHAPPYDTEVSTNAAAAGFVNRTIFPREAITANPNGIYLAFTLRPDPGTTGSSQDFASGPVIPNSLFPLSSRVELWLNDALAFVLHDRLVPLRPGDVPFEGTSHRVPSQSVWNRGADPLGDYEFRWSQRDSQGHGWNIVVPFQVVDELPTGDFNEDGTVDTADYVVWRKTDGTQPGYDAWRANFGRTVAAGGSDAAAPEPPVTTPAVPEPSTLVIACIAAIGIGPAPRRTTRKQRTPLCTA
jgi:hypothetical protein